ncbi:hypothetical protein CLAFUW4_07128 [Fulvia fulva]|uniref:NmrA-like domain-containing protein n=1 Tax=Passalora fulva TaxID=5499 RepID=A0A9Q8PB00_PASFU|nr:uncharacterized protein CLAFUR5_07262 [Fulvia fulva]KAK4621871.1 hypothetical protein CLAFUR4_07137 [Fulvia fulva]KAK4622843.1 hypothetical protein CLAFUR0_07135 [Fulvia fulva]UJO19161.1 hypothetical protein CLAFUR5_07262 [Fulvia fulva]WPV15811.1 hypothetical protein CLAFUW4_07128 [Fulvia fulva]WPV31031.1 hypothetical protein CLAFUW7_07129 [Fulvia fulva]
MATTRRLVVTGATGKQGGALISALLSRPSQPFEIYAITRDKTSGSAQRLANKPNVHVIQGNFDDPVSIFKQIEKPWGLFSVTMPLNAKKEEHQGKAMTAAAVDAGIKHIIFTATDRGPNTDTDPTPIPHFASKFHIEQDIIAKSEAAGKDLTYTFLRPVAFYENLSNNFLGRAFAEMWRLNGPSTELQLISTTDMGKLAAEAFLNAESPEYRNRAISLAGDATSPDEAARVSREETGREMEGTYGVVARTLKWVLNEQLGIMFNWFKSTGFNANVPELRKRYPFLKDFRSWLREESAWKKV